MKNVEIVIIGGGPAGMAAAVSAYDSGARDILILERDIRLGGILNQCIHNGFGLHTFKEELTGPEYAARYEDMCKSREIPYLLKTMVLDITSHKVITAMNENDGVFQITAKSIILCMGCRERTRGAISIAGDRCAGVYNAGAAQKFVNQQGLMPGKKVVILGSGDIGLIMARRMSLEGGKVEAVLELLPYSGGLKRNIVQCLHDFEIPLLLSHTIVKIHGSARVEGVTIAKVDKNKQPIESTYRYIECDTVLLSVGLIPENELTKKMQLGLHPRTNGAEVDENRQTNLSGVFSCGNVLHVHDLVDFVSEEASIAGKASYEYVLSGNTQTQTYNISGGQNVSYVVPQRVSRKACGDIKLMFRVSDELCDVRVKITSGGKEIYNKPRKKVAPGEMESVTLLKDTICGDILAEVIL